MAGAATKSNPQLRLTRALEKDQTLSTKARQLQGLFVGAFGEHTPIDLDLLPHEAGNSLTVHVGKPGHGECTRSILESLLDNVPWLESVFADMKAALERVTTWLSQVDKLFEQIHTWLGKHRPSYEVEETDIKIREAFSGEYAAKKLIIRRGKKAVEVLPRGTWWVTTEGRVDLVGTEQEHALVLSPSEGGWLWVEEGSDVKLRPLTADLFIKLLEDCME